MPSDGPLTSMVLGTVQLGIDYGSVRRRIKPSREDAIKLIDTAYSIGVGGLDTARAYGTAEAIVGAHLQAQQPGFDVSRVVTKLSPLPSLEEDACEYQIESEVADSIEQSCNALGTEKLTTLLLHRAKHSTSHRGRVWQALLKAREHGTVTNLGASVRNPEEFMAVLQVPELQHIQLPANILDWRWVQPHIIDAAMTRPDITIDARSVFLQGVLLQSCPMGWPLYQGVNFRHYRLWMQTWVEKLQLPSVQALCISFVRSIPYVDRLVIGVDNLHQLLCCRDMFFCAVIGPDEFRQIVESQPRPPAALLDPAYWDTHSPFEDHKSRG